MYYNFIAVVPKSKTVASAVAKRSAVHEIFRSVKTAINLKVGQAVIRQKKRPSLELGRERTYTHRRHVYDRRVAPLSGAGLELVERKTVKQAAANAPH